MSFFDEGEDYDGMFDEPEDDSTGHRCECWGECGTTQHGIDEQCPSIDGRWDEDLAMYICRDCELGDFE